MSKLNKLSNNVTEKEVQEYFHDLGYHSIKRGWPDFCFFKGKDIIFVEVKRSDQNTIKSHQRRIKNIFKKLGLDYRVAFGMKDGKPDYKQRAGLNRHLIDTKDMGLV
ncbi:hypothetical protein CMI37_11540 [Candidatus Pacearchaeota archaeon]|jgi:hypothetical protein|nr:hypothetical protein [Candidatus Pacearchaeota archaeon]|tara:strand:- start:10251 stop:10571 length:321 start_codon:yes stop_codon:yes gene_type:complete